jgi:predicted nucleotidyltransferase
MLKNNKNKIINIFFILLKLYNMSNNNNDDINIMKKIRNDLPKKVKDFLYKIEDNLETDLYYYGSINRPDYHHGKSDIDIAIFTDNFNSTILKLQNILKVKYSDFDKVKWMLYGNNINGYKIKCSKFIDIKCEIAIYDNKDKNIVIDDLKNYNYVPWYILYCLFILKTFHYTIPIIPHKNYVSLKIFLFNTLNNKNTNYSVIKQNNK